MKALADGVEQLMVLRLCEHMLEHSKSAGALTRELLEQRVRFGIKCARAHGFKYQSTIGAFIMLMFEIAPDFDRQPTIQGILSNPVLNAEKRIEALTFLVSEEDWEQAVRESNPETWQLAHD